jgi:tellurite resistance protein TerC
VLVASSVHDAFVEIKVPIWAWVATGVVVAVLLLLDIVVLHPQAKAPSMRRALVEVGCWCAIGVAFGAIVGIGFGARAAGEYYSGYLIELSLSVDNVFLWAVIFGYFAVPRQFQHRVLFWGIFGAVCLRAAFIFVGVALVNRFELVLIVFGVFLLYTAYRFLTQDEDAEADPARNPFLRIVRRAVPSTEGYDGQRLFTRIDGRRLATPLFAVLVMIETSDLLFAVDSVPAVLGVSREQFIVLTSNAFAIFGLRALYFVLADMHGRFEYVQHGLALILAFVGVKMILVRWYDISTPISLAVIVIVLAVSVVLSARR